MLRRVPECRFTGSSWTRSALISTGRLAPGEFLPSVRQVAAELTVNPMTVSKAYSLLERDGVVELIRGQGMRVIGRPVPRETVDREEEIRSSVGWSNAAGGRLSPEEICALVNAAFEELHRERVRLSLNNVGKSLDYKQVLDQVSMTDRAGIGRRAAGKERRGQNDADQMRDGPAQAAVGRDSRLRRTGLGSQRPGQGPHRLRAAGTQLYPWMRVRQIIDYQASFTGTGTTSWSNGSWSSGGSIRGQGPPLSVGQQQKLSILLAIGHEPICWCSTNRPPHSTR